MRLKLGSLLFLLGWFGLANGQSDDPSGSQDSSDITTESTTTTTVIPSTTTTKLNCYWLAESWFLSSYNGECCSAESVAYLDSTYKRSTWTNAYWNRNDYIAELKKNGICGASTTTSTTRATTTTSEETTTTS